MKTPMAIVVVVLLVVGCSSDDEPGGTALPADAATAIAGSREAMNAYDTETMSTYLTDDFTFQSYGDVNDLDGYLEYINTFYKTGDFNLTVTGDAAMVEGQDTIIVAEPGLTTGDGIPDLRGFSVYTLVESEGTWLIDQVRWIGEPLP